MTSEWNRLRHQISSTAAVMTLFLLVGCGNSGAGSRLEMGGTERTDVQISSSKAVLIVPPQDALSNGKPLKRTGRAVARRIDASFSQYARLVDVLPQGDASKDKIKEAVAKKGYDYIVSAHILRWSADGDHWTKVPAGITLQIKVVDAKTDEEISSNMIEGKPSSTNLNPLTWFQETTITPDEFLIEPLDDYVDSLYCSLCVY